MNKSLNILKKFFKDNNFELEFLKISSLNETLKEEDFSPETNAFKFNRSEKIYNYDIFNLNRTIGRHVDKVFYSKDEDDYIQGKNDWIIEFLKLNKDFFSNYTLKRYLGSGVYADAYELMDGRVLKIMLNSKDLFYYKEQQDELFDSQKGSVHNLMVYDLGTFDTPKKIMDFNLEKISSISWVVMEKLDSVHEKIYSYDDELPGLNKYLKNITDTLPKDISQEFKTSFNQLRKTFVSEKFNKLLKDNLIPKITNNIDMEKFAFQYFINPMLKSNLYQTKFEPLFNNYKQRLGFEEDWIEKIIISMVYQMLRGNEDLHQGNLGYRGNQPVYFDPSNFRPINSKKTKTTTPQIKDEKKEETVNFEDLTNNKTFDF